MWGVAASEAVLYFFVSTCPCQIHACAVSPCQDIATALSHNRCEIAFCGYAQLYMKPKQNLFVRLLCALDDKINNNIAIKISLIFSAFVCYFAVN